MTSQHQIASTDESLSNREDPTEVEEITIDDVEPVTTSGKTVSRVELGSSYLPEQASAEANDGWQHIQSKFVDDPRQTVAEAHELVGKIMQQIVDAFAYERRELERQWSEGDSVSTEDLRICLQRYRAFFSRLLPSVNGLATHD